MASQPKEKSDGSSQPLSFWAESMQAARGGAAVAAAFFAVLALAGYLFAGHRRERAAELDAQLAQNAARLGQEVELKFKNYRALIDNVTRIMTSAGAAAAELQRTALAQAQAADAEAAEREEQLRRRLATATEAKTAAEAKQKNSEVSHDTSAATLKARREAAEAAERGLSEATKTLQDANGELKVKAGELRAAEERLAAQKTEADSPAQQAAGAATPATVAAAGASPSAAPDPASSSPLAVAAPPDLADAQSAVSKARNEFQQAQERSEAAWQVALRRIIEADAATAAVEAASAAAKAAKQTKDAAEKGAKAARQATDKQSSDVDQAHTDKVARDQKLTQAVRLDPKAEAANTLKALDGLVLPSQVARLERCRDQPSVDTVKLCVAKELAELNDVRGLEMVPCPSANTAATVSDDGRFLIIPPSSVGGTGSASNAQPACGRVEIRRLLAGTGDEQQPAAEANNGAFDSVLLLRRDGTTLHSLDFGANLRIAALPGFDAKRAEASAVLPELALGVTKYRGFLQPIRLQLVKTACDAKPDCKDTESRERADLVLCGLSREDRLAKASVAISLPSYLWFVLVLGLGLLSLPLAKLWLLGPKTSFTTFDVTLLATSAALLTLIGPVLVLAFAAHNRLDKRADNQVNHVGTELEHRLSAEIGATARRLEAFRASQSLGDEIAPLLDLSEAKDAPKERFESCEKLGGNLVDSLFGDGDDVRTRSVCERTDYTLAGKQDPGWKLIFLMDQAGDERVKLVPGERDSTAVSIKARSYFKRALKQDTACLVPDRGYCKTRGAADLVRSITSGSIVLVVAQPVCKHEGCVAGAAATPEPPIGVAAIEGELTTFQHLVLPLGIQAAVIDADGRIMLHSNNDAHHDQSVLGEVTEPEELRAALAARVPDTISVTYLGQASRLHVEPLRLPGSGWSVLTIAPRSIIDIAIADMVLAALFGYGTLLALALLAVCFALVVIKVVRWSLSSDLDDLAHDHDHRPSLRPHAAHCRDYAELGKWAIALGAIICAVAVFFTRLLPTTLGLALVVALCWRTVKRLPRVHWIGVGGKRSVSTPAVSGSSPQRGWRDFLPLTYTLCIAGLAEVFVMAPATVLFSGAYDHVVDNLARAEQDHFASLLHGRDACIAALGQADACEPPRAPTEGCGSVIGSGEERVVASAQVSDSWDFLRSRVLSPVPYLADLLPPVGAAEAEDSGRLYRIETIGRPRPAPTEYVSVREPGKMLLASAHSGRVLLSTPLPPLIGFDYHWFTFALLLLIAAGALAAGYVVGFHSLKRLFFLDVLLRFEHGRIPVRRFLEQLVPARKVLVFHASASVRAELEKKTRLLQDLSPLAESPSSETWLVGDLGPSLDDAAGPQRLSALAGQPQSVIVLAYGDPIQDAPAELQRAWALALERFELVELSAQPEPPLPATGDDLPNAPAPHPASVARAWFESNETERRLLVQLAIGGCVTPHPANVEPLKALASRGLLDPETMTILDEELACFARRATSKTEQDAWAAEDRGTAWAALRLPLTAGVGSLLTAVTISKPELGVASAIVPTLAAGLPTVLKILTQMIAPKPSGPG